MLNRIKISIIAGFALLAPLAVPVAVSASTVPDTANAACAGANLKADQLTNATPGNCTDAESSGSIDNLVTTIINIFTWVVGVVSVIMIIIAGFKYVVSSGDSGGVQSAKNTIIYAIVGLVVVIFAQVIVRFVLTNIGT